jgi:hypothetical protein
MTLLLSTVFYLLSFLLFINKGVIETIKSKENQSLKKELEQFKSEEYKSGKSNVI